MRIGGVGSCGAVGLFSVALTLGCSSSSSPSNAPSGSGGLGGAPACPHTPGNESPIFEQSPGVFQALVYPEWMMLEGKVLESPRGEIHDEAEREGSCRLLTYESPAFCDPICENPQLCVRGSCISFPEPLPAGDVSLQLSGGPTIELPPRNGAYSWSSEDFGLADADTVAISAPGDVAGGFELRACAFEAPTPTENWDDLMAARKPGEDVVLRWSNPVDVARVYLRMTTGIGTHGGISPVELECEGPDVGSLALPGGYLDKLYQGGWACGECGQNNLLRYHADQAGSDGDAVQLRVGSTAAFWFHPGLQ